MPVASVPARGRLVRSLAALTVASLAAETMLFPVSALMFSRVTFAGLLLNFLAIPLMAVAQVAGMLVVPLEVLNLLPTSNLLNPLHLLNHD